MKIVLFDPSLKDNNGNNQLQKLRLLPAAEQERIINGFLEGCDGCDSVVLIDEVDKAPRDFPNDILNEIENIEFEIRELNFKITLDKESQGKKIFVLLTSNFEKNLPEAFLRRCIYHHIEFIEDVAILKEIIKLHVPVTDESQLGDRIKEMLIIRKDNALQKKPATSEMIDCIKWLVHDKIMGNHVQNSKAALSTLLKKSEDLKLFTSRLTQ